MLVLYINYECTNGVTILYLMHWTYAHMDVAFANIMNRLKSFK